MVSLCGGESTAALKGRAPDETGKEQPEFRAAHTRSTSQLSHMLPGDILAYSTHSCFALHLFALRLYEEAEAVPAGGAMDRSKRSTVLSAKALASNRS